MPRQGSGAAASARGIARVIAAAGAIAALAGCAKMGAALGEQWVVVQFAPNTTVATARHITSACDRVPNLRLASPVRPTSAQPGVVTSVRYSASHASDADMARLQSCLQRFPAVQGFTLTQPGDG